MIAGPCVIESEELTLEIAGRLRELVGKLPLNLVFKASFDKANRTSLESYRGPGMKDGLRILQRACDARHPNWHQHRITQMRGQGANFRFLPSGLSWRACWTAPTIRRTPRPRTIRLKIIWAVTTRRATWLAGEMSPKPTVAKTVTVK